MTAPASMPTCPNCSAALPDGAVRCPSCGRLVATLGREPLALRVVLAVLITPFFLFVGAMGSCLLLFGHPRHERLAVLLGVVVLALWIGALYLLFRRPRKP